MADATIIWGSYCWWNLHDSTSKEGRKYFKKSKIILPAEKLIMFSIEYKNIICFTVFTFASAGD